MCFVFFIVLKNKYYQYYHLINNEIYHDENKYVIIMFFVIIKISSHIVVRDEFTSICVTYTTTIVNYNSCKLEYPMWENFDRRNYCNKKKKKRK